MYWWVNKLSDLPTSPEKLCKELHSLGAVETLAKLLAHQGESQKVVQMALRAVAALLDSGTCTTCSQTHSYTMCTLIYLRRTERQCG